MIYKMEHKPRCLGTQKEQYAIVVQFRKPRCNKHPFAAAVACFMSSVLLLTILLLALNHYGSEPPITGLKTFTLHMGSGNFTVVFQARNPSWVLGFRHQYLHTVVSVASAHNQSTLLGRTQVPEFAVAERASKSVCADGVFGGNKTVGLGRRLAVAVGAQVKVKGVGWRRPKWQNFTCWVDTGAVPRYGCNEDCGRYDACGLRYSFSENCTL